MDRSLRGARAGQARGVRHARSCKAGGGHGTRRADSLTVRSPRLLQARAAKERSDSGAIAIFEGSPEALPSIVANRIDLRPEDGAQNPPRLGFARGFETCED